MYIKHVGNGICVVCDNNKVIKRVATELETDMFHAKNELLVTVHEQYAENQHWRNAYRELSNEYGRLVMTNSIKQRDAVNKAA